MVNEFFNVWKFDLGAGDSDFQVDDFRMLLAMSNYSFATDRSANTLSVMSLDEYDGANYARQALANESWTRDDPNNRSEFNCDPVVWTSLGAGTRQATAAILFSFVTNDADSPAVLHIDQGGFPFDGTGSDNTLTPDAEGLIQI